MLIFEDYLLDSDRRELRRGAELVSVEPQVFDLLLFLLRHRTRVVSKDELIASVWNGRVISDSTFSSRIALVRQAIGDTGEAQRLLRTIARKGFRFVGAVRESGRPSGNGAASAQEVAVPAQNSLPAKALELPDRPSIAVLAFANMSGDASQDYLCDGITEDILTELARFSDLFVIARNSSFQYKGKSVDIRQIGRELGVRYVLEGSIRREGDRLRLAAQLIDAVSGAHCWAERYDRKLTDVFSLQDELARAIAPILAARINKAEAERTLNKPPATWGAYDYYMRASDTFVSYWASFNVEKLYEVRHLLEQSLAMDPEYARAYAQLSCTHLSAYLSPLDEDYLNPRCLARADELARKALQLDPNHPEVHTYLGAVLASQRQYDAAIAEFEKAIALNPNLSHPHFPMVLLWAGEAARVIEAVERHMRLDPFYAPQAVGCMGMAFYLLGEYPRALSPLQECALRAPNYPGGQLWLAATHAQLGQLKEARMRAAEVLRIQPDYSMAADPRTLVFRCPEHVEHLFDGLRKAGLPETSVSAALSR